MPHPRFKSENYENFGGINVKASAYNTGPRDVLDLKNFDFSVIGAWTKRPGSTQFLGQTFSTITGVHEYVRIDGFSQLMVGSSGGMWAGATTGTMGGLSNAALGTTFLTPIHNDMVSVAQATFFVGTSSFFALSNNFLRSATFSIEPAGWRNQDWDFVNYLNQAYMANGSNLLRYNGATTFFPYLLAPYGTSYFGFIGTTGAASFGLPLGQVYHAFASSISNNGTEGPLVHLGVFDLASTNAATIASYSGSYALLQTPVLTPSSFGLSAVNLYIAVEPGISWFNASYGKTAFNLDIRFLRSQAVSGNDSTVIQYGLTTDQLQNGGVTALPVASQVIYPFLTPGFGASSVLPFDLGDLALNVAIQGHTFSPRFLEIYNNRLALVGFSLLPSTFAVTEIAQPESILPESVFEVRTNDGDVLTGARFYLNQLILFKQKSVHAFTGDAPENFYLKQISNEFGCLNNKAACVWNDRLWFLDEKGIVEFNGANIGSVSTKVETIFADMNVSAAINTAVMLHQKERNEIWCGIPVNGATLNNLTVVFDYDANAWTTWDGFNPKYFANVRQRLNKTSGLYADYVGRVNYFDSDFGGDNGVGISCVVKARYEHPLGQSTEKMFRRAFINYESTSGATITGFDLKLRRNYGDSVVVSKGITLSSFQQVTNFGVSAKSLSVEVGHFSATERLRIYGYTLEYRYQRST